MTSGSANIVNFLDPLFTLATTKIKPTMPQQQRLSFEGRSTQKRRASTVKDNTSSRAPSEYESEPSQSFALTLAPDTESQSSIRSTKSKLRTSWIFDHMPSEDREYRYYNTKTGLLE